MRILIDTQAWVWWLIEPRKLSRDAIALLEDRQTTVYLSTVCVWEVVIKYAVGKLVLPAAPAIMVPRSMADDGLVELPIEHRHALQVTHLPLHHRDPFDRVIIAQAQVEGMPILTADRQFARYDVDVIQAG
jgi:PIN domain nuclease of toxin-antitoxin system